MHFNSTKSWIHPDCYVTVCVYACVCVCKHECGSKQFEIWQIVDRVTAYLPRECRNKIKHWGPKLKVPKNLSEFFFSVSFLFFKFWGPLLNNDRVQSSPTSDVPRKVTLIMVG